MTDTFDAALRRTDWRDPFEVVRDLNNLVAAWSGFTEMLAVEPDGPYAASDRADAELAHSRFLRCIEMAVLARGLPPAFGALLAGATSGEQAGTWLRPMIEAVRTRRNLAYKLGEHAALVRVAVRHAQALVEAIEWDANRDAMLPLVAAARADNLLSPEEAEVLAGPDRVAALRCADALGTGWR